jgi:hypothetical protein
MKLSTILALTAAVTTSAMTTTAFADPDAAPRRRVVVSSQTSDTFTETSPNAELIASGLFTFAVPYIASVAVATSSTRPGDNYLYTPVAGPWLDLSNRQGCPSSSGCGNETTYNILLVADGVLQGFGALEVLAGILFPEEHSVESDSSAPRVHVAPSVARGSAGLTAFGRF